MDALALVAGVGHCGCSAAGAACSRGCQTVNHDFPSFFSGPFKISP